MKIRRRFTRKGKSPYQGIAFEERTSEIRDPDGRVIFHQDGVTVPSSWSQIATDILAQKYFRKTGVPAGDGSTGGENDARQVFHRLGHTWMDWGRRGGYFTDEEDAQSFYDEICHMLARQVAAPNSPQWFNTGLYAVYGIKGPAQGHHYVDPETGELKEASSAYERPQPHACQPYHAPVSTPAGPISIGMIVEKGLTGLVVFDGTDSGRGTTRVVAAARNGVKPVFRVVLENRSFLEATGDHLVLASPQGGVPGEWVQVNELTPGMCLHLSTAADVCTPVTAAPPGVDAAALVGSPQGGGSAGRPARHPAQRARGLREQGVQRLEFVGLMPVYDIQTESGQYLSNNIVVHNCFIISVEDDLVGEGGIMDLVTSEARLFKYGSGTGTNYSRLRAKGEPLSGGGVSSGLLSFLKVGDRSASAIKSGGTTRRAARMVTLDADHPDVEEYVDWKVAEEHKVVSMVVGSRILKTHTSALEEAVGGYAGNNGSPDLKAFDPRENPQLREALRDALAEEIPPAYLYRILQLLRQGYRNLDLQEYTAEWDEEAYRTVSGQSSNNSLRLTSAFMQKVLDDDQWTLNGRVDQESEVSLPARSLWDRIAHAAWSCADPGVQYHSTINEWHTCPEDGEIRASNPCSEYMFLDDTACNLASLNLMTFYDRDAGVFDVEGLRHAIELWTVVLEISVLMAQFPSARIARNSFDYRTLGLGFANLGSLLMVMGVAYDSEEGRAIAAALAAILSGQAYATSARMASELGPFARFAANRDHMLRVIRNHRRAIYCSPEEEYEGLSVVPRGFAEERCPAELTAAARAVWDEALELGEKHGFRNAQVTAIAPTGTIGLVMDCDTTGVEPDFALVKLKKLAGGGSFKIINASIPPALERLGYTRRQVEEIAAYCVGRKTLQEAPGVSWDALKAKGFGAEALQRVDRALENAFSLHGAFIPPVLGREFLEKTMGLEASTFEAPGFRLLGHLGFSDAETEAAESYACGTMTVEGAPHLKNEHYPVFDTANRSGRIGRRFIPWHAHIEMMAAVQPFVSGAISKTVNMPQGATVEDIKGAYFLSWQRMLKSIAVYRDGSKLSQPLSSLNAAEDPLVAQILALKREGLRGGPSPHVETSVPAPTPAASVTAEAAEAGKDRPGGTPARTKRRSLPNRRKGYTQKAKIGQHSIFVRTGEYPDGSLGEIFLDMHREGAAFRSLLNSFAIAVSLGLQYGVPLEKLVDAFVFTRFEPNGIVQGHDNIKITTSVLDFIFRDLALSYLKRGDLVQVKPDDLIATGTNGKREGDTPAASGGEVSEEPEMLETARLQGYEGDPCSVCGHLTLVRNGTCLKCMTCGSTTGCS